MLGELFVVGTPIGNLNDMTLRGIQTLKNVDIIAAEDTRNTRKLLTHFEIKTPMLSYHEHNKKSATLAIMEKYLFNGQSVALVSDAGMPLICDPGFELIKEAIENGIKVTTVPSATAFVSAAILSGFVGGGFIFDGFLPYENKEKIKLLEELKTETRDVIFYEAPHKLLKTLKAIYETLGNRLIALARELTKMHEEVLRFSIKEAIKYYEENEPRGEYVLVIRGVDKKVLEKEEIAKNNEIDLKTGLKAYLDAGIEKKEAIKRLARERGLNKREVYKRLL